MILAFSEIKLFTQIPSLNFDSGGIVLSQFGFISAVINEFTNHVPKVITVAETP